MTPSLRAVFCAVLLGGNGIMKFLNLDSPLMRFLSRMTDILWLNILVLIFFVPPGLVAYFFFQSIVASGQDPTITTEILMMVCIYIAAMPIGAAFTALHYVCLKMVRDEEGYITKSFFKSFKLNFRQATIIWAVAMLFIGILAFNFRNIQGMDHSSFFFATTAVASIFVLCTLLYVFPILSHFENSIKGTIKNAFFMSILALPRTVIMAVLAAVPVVILYFVEKYQVMVWLIPLTMLFWFSLPAYYSAKLYSPTFKRFEPKVETTDDMEWTVSTEGGETAEVPEIETSEATAVDAEQTEKEENNI